MAAPVCLPERLLTQATLTLAISALFVAQLHARPVTSTDSNVTMFSPHAAAADADVGWRQWLTRDDADGRTRGIDEAGARADDGYIVSSNSAAEGAGAATQSATRRQVSFTNQHPQLVQHQQQLKRPTKSRTRRSVNLSPIKIMGLDNIDFTASTLDRTLSADAQRHTDGTERIRLRPPPTSASSTGGRRRLQGSIRLKDLRKMLQQMSEAG